MLQNKKMMQISRMMLLTNGTCAVLVIILCFVSSAQGNDDQQFNVTLFKMYQCHDKQETEEKKLKKEILYTHNKLRWYHGCSPLNWKRSLFLAAKEHVLELAKNNRLYHSSDVKIMEAKGENIARKRIAIGGKEDVVFGPASLIALQWYNEIENYNYDCHCKKQWSGRDIGHFTQLIWKSTTHVGCAMAFAEDTKSTWQTTYLVCQYLPAGNDVDLQRRIDNVPMPLSGDPRPIEPKDVDDFDINGCCDYTAICGRYCSRFCEVVTTVCCESCQSKEHCKATRKADKTGN